MDSEHGSHSVRELANTVGLIELLDGPFEANCEHDSIARVDEESALRLNPELQEVLNADISVLTAFSTRWDGPCFRRVVPVSRLHQLLHLIVDLVSTGIGVFDRNESAGMS